MEQMVMLLPAQIPVAELIRLKSLTKNGKSQLVNMQLDALIKPSLIQSEHGDSEDLPLMARAKLASIQGAQSASGASSSSAQVGGAGGMASSQGIDFSMPVAGAGAGIYGLLDSANNKNPADISAMHSLSSSSLGSTQVPSALSTSNGRSSTTSTSSRGGNQTFVTPSPSLSSPSLAFPSANGQMKHVSYPQQQQQQPDPSALQFTSSITPINTNIVIDNNMAETLVNYFYMVASNPPPNGDDKQQANSAQSQGSGLASGGSGSGGSNGGSIPGIGLDGVGHATMGMDIGGHGPLLPSATSILAAQQHQQQSPSLASFVQMKGDPNTAAVQAQHPQQHQPPHMTFGQLYDPSSGLKQVHKDHQSFV
ncbi:hypothetical protein GGI11_007734 [Coemansia sp. RSA 2049]|nr:hypothetical protein GGI11_007734 [Coemansia sp. RSA 2049]